MERTKLSERENAPAVWTDTNGRFRIERNVIDGTALWDEEVEALYKILCKHLGRHWMPGAFKQHGAETGRLDSSQSNITEL
jgi:hypothetical protein